jgi:hypothetical protein
MSLVDTMLDQLATARRIVEDGTEVVPAWLISTPEAPFLVLTRFDTDKPEQRERALHLITRFMAWKLATSFVLTAETWLGPVITRSGQEALLVVGVSRHERRAAMQKIVRDSPVDFGPVVWLAPEQVDETDFNLLPAKTSEITIDEIVELSAIFGEGGEMQAERFS